MGEGQGVFNSNKTSIGWAIAFGCTTNCHLSVHSLALPRPGSGDDSRGGGTGTGAPGGGSRRGRRRTSGDANLSEGGGDPMSAPFLAVSAGRGHGVDVACLNVFLTAALQRVMREAVLVQAPASASMVPSAVSVLLIPVFRAILLPVLLVVLVNLLRFAVNVLSSARLAGALLRVELLHARS